jgi:sulfate adenylyltransferase subunit 2
MVSTTLCHLDLLEAESIHMLREVVAESGRSAMLYSMGKDSSVMLRLAQKAFYPGRIPFPLLHIDTGFKFTEMIEFRDRTAQELRLELLVYTNEDARSAGANPFQLGPSRCCALLKTKALLDALGAYRIETAIGGARRDEERSRAKERAF